MALFLALGVMLGVQARPTAAAQNSCKRSCGAEQRACRAAFKATFRASKASCTGTGKAKRQCVKTAGRIYQNAVKACHEFASTCRSCCKAGGTDCDAQCGDGIVADGEACDPPGGDSCTEGAICGGSCQCVAAAVSVDEARAATKTFPPEGGSLEATAVDGTVYSLTIPPGALLFETPITMTPIVSIAGGDLPGGSVLGVDLQPSGLRLYEFAELRITSPQLGPTTDIAGFSYEGDGNDLHRYPAALEAGRILLHVIHFSGAGAGICVELCPPPIDPPPPPLTESELEELIARLDPHDPFYAARLTELLHAYYDLFIAPNLPLMEQNCEYATSRVPKVLAWSRTNQLLLNEEGFEGKNQTIGDSLVRSVGNCWSEATDPCLDPNNAYQVQNLLRISRQAQLLGGDPDMFDPSKVRRCSGLWSGTITYERKYDEDAAWEDAGSHTRRTRLRETQAWQILPHVIGDPCVECTSKMFEATWKGSASVDNFYFTDYGTCTDTVTMQDQIDGAASPSAFFIAVTRDQSTVYFYRASPGYQGAPPNGVVDRPYAAKHVYCNGYEETRPIASLHVAENWTLWTLGGLPLGRTDPTIPTTVAGEKVERQEETGIGGGLIVITTTWTWQLTIEPESVVGSGEKHPVGHPGAEGEVAVFEDAVREGGEAALELAKRWVSDDGGVGSRVEVGTSP